MSIFNFFSSFNKGKVSEYHQYPESSSEEQKKIDGFIRFKNINSLKQISIHNIRLSQQQVYQTMLGEGDNSFIYHFDQDLMIYFFNNHDSEIRVVLENMCKEICTELAKTQFVEFSNGFAIAPKAATPYYEELMYLGNFLENPGFKKVITDDTQFAVNLCECLNTLIFDIGRRIKEIYNQNRNIQSTTTGILEQIQFYTTEKLSLIIRYIYEEAQQRDAEAIINGLIGGTQSAQKNKIIERLAETVKSFDISELPKEAFESYEEIKVFITDLEPHREKMSDDALLLYKKLVDERLPEILEQYIVFPKKFLEIYRDREDSPQKLITQSLKSMEKALQEIHVSYFSKRMLDLQVTKIYMEQMAQGL